MTITQTIAYIKSHPFYASARQDEDVMDELLFALMLHMYEVMSGNCARAYRVSKCMNGPQIVEAIRDIEPPRNLDLRLPIPEIECVVVSIKNSALISDAGRELEEM